MNEEAKDIGDKLSTRLVNQVIEMRKEKGITQRELAQLSGVRLSVITKMENGTSYPRLFTFLKILEGLDMTLQTVPLEDVVIVPPMEYTPKTKVV